MTYLSADSVTDREYDYIQPEVLHTFNPSGFPLHQLELKNSAPLMLLQNLDPMHGLYNGTQLRLIRSTRRILECCVLGAVGNDNMVFIPRMALDTGLEDSPVPFHQLQFPVHLAYGMTINKSQDQTLQHPRNIKVLFPHDPDHPANTTAMNVVWNEVFRNLEL